MTTRRRDPIPTWSHLKTWFGVGRLVVPAIGQPIVCAPEGAILPLVAWALVTVNADLVGGTGRDDRIADEQLQRDLTSEPLKRNER